MHSDPQSRAWVVERLRAELPGKNLYDLAGAYAVTVEKNGRVNKGWVGQTLEQVALLTSGSAQRRDGSDFELKSTSLLPENESWKPKETIKITQLSPKALIEETFETSMLWEKLSSLVLVGCHHVSPTECTVVRISAIDITDPILVDEIRAFWEEVRLTLTMGEIAEFPFEGTSEDLVQLRPVGDGKQVSTCPVTGRRFPARAFYGTKRLIRSILGL